MSGWSRRSLLGTLGFAALGQTAFASLPKTRTRQSENLKTKSIPKLALEDYLPKSMLHVRETQVPRSMFPVIDFHTHLSWSGRRGKKPEAHNNATPDEVLPVMDRKNVRMMVRGDPRIGLHRVAAPRQVHCFHRTLVRKDPRTKLSTVSSRSNCARQCGRSSRSQGSKDSRTLFARTINHWSAGQD